VITGIEQDLYRIIFVEPGPSDVVTDGQRLVVHRRVAARVFGHGGYLAVHPPEHGVQICDLPPIKRLAVPRWRRFKLLATTPMLGYPSGNRRSTVRITAIGQRLKIVENDLVPAPLYLGRWVPGRNSSEPYD
jgi:hypothetical protein